MGVQALPLLAQRPRSATGPQGAGGEQHDDDQRESRGVGLHEPVPCARLPQQPAAEHQQAHVGQPEQKQTVVGALQGHGCGAGAGEAAHQRGARACGGGPPGERRHRGWAIQASLGWVSGCRWARLGIAAEHDGNVAPSRALVAPVAPLFHGGAICCTPGRRSAASPVIMKAWQRQPPKSLWRSSQVRQGAFIQLSPRKALKALLRCQISAMGVSLTLGKREVGQVARVVAGHGQAVGRHAEEHRAPAVHAGLGALFKVVGHHEQHAGFGPGFAFLLGAELGDHGFGLPQLVAAWASGGRG